jgi:methyl-accepting chemotaxis protein
MIANAVVEGDLSVRGDTIKFQGGYKEIIEGMNKTMVEIELPFSEISEVLSYMASGDFTHSIVKDFKGEYGKVKDAMNNMAESINEVLGNIDLAADQVAEGSRQISDGSQAMSQGATEQSSSIEELETTVSEIAKQTGQNAVNASQANNMASKARETAESGNELMKQMVKSMEEINESSANISKIIKVIDEIAFQTNMLSLNAAVEAARAGQHGKGFAVVAEEVRNLAAKSSNAVKDTTAMIESSIKKAEVGTKIADSTANALAKIVTEVENATKLVNDIAIASNQQATSISQISIGLGQVFQSNSASTEQSAASIEELSSQAQLLKDMVTKFTLRKKGGNSNQGSLLNSFGKSNNLTAKSKSANERNRISLANSSLGKY